MTIASSPGRGAVADPGHQLTEGVSIRSRRWIARIGLVCVGISLYGPWLRRGYLLSYDWTSGPHLVLPSGVYGLGEGRAAVAPVVLVLHLLSSLTFGIDPVAIALLLSPLVIGFGMESVLGDRPLAWFSAALLVSVNPFVDERLGVGAFGVVLALDVLPFLITAASQASSGQIQACVRCALLTVAGTALAPQFLLIAALLIVLTIAAQRWRTSSQVAIRRSIQGWFVGVALFFVCSTYWIVPSVVGGFPAYQRIGGGDLAAFPTQSDPHLGLLINLLGLYGFWRPALRSTKDIVGDWWIFLAAILVVVGYGWYRFRSRFDVRLKYGLLLSAVVGLALAAGPKGPTGGLFTALYNHVPGFRSFREPEKALLLLVLVYGTFFGVGVHRLVVGLGNRVARMTFGLVLLGLPFSYGVAQFWGLNELIKPIHYPVSWYQAERRIASAPGRILFLPWHSYQVYPFTGNRVVASPAPGFFSGDILVSENAEMPALGDDSTDPREAWVLHIEQAAQSENEIGKLLVPLGVRWVVLYHTTTWQADQWLFRQRDLVEIQRWRDLDLFENLDWAGEAYAKGLGGTVVPMALAPTSPIEVSTSRTLLTGKVTITLTNPYDKGWHIAGLKSHINAAGTNSFYADLSSARGLRSFTFAPWRITKVALVLSGLAVVTALASLLIRRRVPVDRSDTDL